MTFKYPRRPWTQAETDHAIELLRAGVCVAALERTLQRSYGAVIQYLHVSQLYVADERRADGGCRTAKEIAQLLGVGEKLVQIWIAAGELAQAGRGRSARRASRWITDAALMDFIEHRPAWAEWDPAAIQDRDWREHAEDIRRPAGGHWLTKNAVAGRYRVTRTAVGKWITCGVLPTMRRGHRHYIWSADLDGWRPPFELFDSAARSAANRRAWDTRRQRAERL